MASKCDSLKLSRAQDRRAKATDEQVAEMKRLYDNGTTQKAIGEMFNMSQAAVGYIVSDKARQGLREYRLKNPPKRRTKEEQTAYIRDLRKYKKEIMENGSCDSQLRRKELEKAEAK